MMATAVPSLIAQSGDFKVQVKVGSSADAKIIATKTPFRPVLEFEFDGYDIQTRMDNDDIVLPGYIEKIQSFYDGTPKVVTFQMHKYDWDTGEFYKSAPYSKQRCSMFSSFLCPPKGLNILSRKHGELHELATVSVVNEKMCFLVVHGLNAASKILAGDTLLPSKGRI
jgi:hypothetical protein